MNKDTFKEFKSLQLTYSEACETVSSTANTIGSELAKQINERYKENFPEKYNEYQDYTTSWIRRFDSIKVEFGHRKTFIEYWEQGRCGNQDECVHSIELTEDLLGPDGVAEYVANWIVEISKMFDTQEKQEKLDKARKIKELESALKTLKG